MMLIVIASLIVGALLLALALGAAANDRDEGDAARTRMYGAGSDLL